MLTTAGSADKERAHLSFIEISEEGKEVPRRSSLILDPMPLPRIISPRPLGLVMRLDGAICMSDVASTESRLRLLLLLT